MRRPAILLGAAVLILTALPSAAQAWLTLGKPPSSLSNRVPANIVTTTADPQCGEIGQKMDHVKSTMAKKNEMFMDACFINNELIAAAVSNKCGDSANQPPLDCEKERLAICQSTKDQAASLSTYFANNIEACDYGKFLAGWGWATDINNVSSALNCGVNLSIYPDDPAKTFKTHADSMLGAKAQDCYKKFNL